MPTSGMRGGGTRPAACVAEVGLDVISDGELGKTSFLAYAEERLTGFVPMTANDPDA